MRLLPAVLLLILSSLVGNPSSADVFRWDNGELIPGTAGIEVGPGVNLQNLNLAYAGLSGNDLAFADFRNADLSHADLSSVFFDRTILTDADFSGAIVRGTRFSGSGLTDAQLYSTASYQSKDLRGITFGGGFLIGNDEQSFWNLQGQDLTGAVLAGGAMPDSDFFQANLTAARLAGVDLVGANFTEAKLVNADLASANLRKVDFERADLTNATLARATLDDANLTEAVITGANFSGSQLSYEQLQTTVNFRTRNLRGVGLGKANLVGWDFSRWDLTGADFSGAELENVNLEGALVAEADFSYISDLSPDLIYSTASYQRKHLSKVSMVRNDLSNWNLREQNLTGANFTASSLRNTIFADAIITEANFSDTTSRGLLESQFVSTASYQQKNLQGVDLSFDDLTAWDLRDQILTYAGFSGATLTGTRFEGAHVVGADFSSTTTRGFTRATLEGTASFQNRTLQSVLLRWNDLSGWSFRDQDLTGSDMRGAKLEDADLSNATIRNADFSSTVWRGFTPEQLYSTNSYRSRYLSGVNLGSNNLTEWDLSLQDLGRSSFVGATLKGTDFSSANLGMANFSRTIDLSLAVFNDRTTFDQWTLFPEDFDPIIAGLTQVITANGDFDANGVLDIRDVEILEMAITGRPHFSSPDDRLDAMLDINNDAFVDDTDVRYWFTDLKQAWIGDANLDGEFNSGDLVVVFQAGKYDLDVAASWTDGDWNNDQRFDSQDFVAAFMDGGYEIGLRNVVSPVPEPSVFWSLFCAALLSVHRPPARH